MTTSVNTVSVALSAQVSGAFGMRNSDFVGITAPAVTSCDIYLLGSPDNAEANFTRVAKLDGSGPFIWAVGVGSSSLRAEPLEAFAFGKVECSVAQAAERIFTITTKQP